MRINTNINSMRTQEYMRQNQAKMSNAMDRLSSGKRINNASDDAAGLAIATRMRAREGGLNVAANNTQDGMAVIRTADSAMNSVSNILLRMRDIANQSANGTNTDNNKAALQKEFAQLHEQINYIANNTQFNDQDLLNKDNNVIKIQTLDSNDTTKQIGINLSNVTTESLKLDKIAIGGELKIDAETLKAANTAIKVLENTTKDVTDLDKDVAAAKTAYESVKGYMTAKQQENMDKAFEDYTKATGSDAPAIKTAKQNAAKKIFSDFGTNGPTTNATGPANPSAAIKAIDDALKTVADNRATLGATLNRLDFNVNNLKSQQSSMASAASQIEDADMAKEMSEMTKFKILNEAGISMLSQANQTPQMVSKLLQ
ncbi:flagellin [Bacillus cereus group sp. TH153LC]|uniref:flagellin N-terminal helical domain-containing protein n=1 Tax=Bacillus cereus group sp. TH153LC TaxID=3018059 RepID=UPI0022E31CEF|nr:flagellin [Bacillus cereus group sp. TH153LC]MDA1658428.1 flagellin [Bacillus cereus group sp. TH153LC]